MKKFIATVIAYALLLCLLTAGVNSACDELGLNKSGEFIRFSVMPDQVQICNLGSSHGLYAFTYEELSIDAAFNFAFSAQMLSYDLRLLTYYQDHIAPNAIVFVPVSYFSLYGRPETQEWAFIEKNVRYYSLLPARLIKEFDLKTALNVRARALTLGPSLLEEVIEAIGQPPPEVVLGGRGGYWLQRTDPAGAAGDAVTAAERHLFDNKLNDEGVRLPNQEEIDALYGIIDLCRERGATPILITTPYLSEYSEEIRRIDPDFLPGFHALIDEIRQATGVEYYDYSEDARFEGQYSLFINSDHLNQDGAVEFTRIVLDEVVKDRLELS